MTEDRAAATAAWAGVAIQALSTHCLLWDHSPSYQGAVRRAWARLPRLPERTRITGRLGADLDELLRRCGL